MSVSPLKSRMEGSAKTLARLRQSLAAYKQSHLLEFLPEAPHTRHAYLKTLEKLDLPFVANAFHNSTKADQDAKKQNATPTVAPLHVTPSTTLPTADADRVEGLRLIAAGQVAALLLAGGSGTRLGSDAPKGCYDIGMPSRKSLFQYHAERVLAVRRLAAEHAGVPLEAVRLPLLVMTSAANDAATREFFASHGNFGLPEKQLRFFAQGMLPAFSSDGKILRASRGELALSPNGNGGVYLSLHESGMLAQLEREGVTSLFQFGVDNVLCRVAEPTFVGFCANRGAECGVKTIAKDDPHEKVGVLALVDGAPSVVEYSEITRTMAEARADDGRLIYGSAHICINWFSVPFLRRFTDEHLLSSLPLHVARKKVAFIDEHGSLETPEEPNATKLELFIFDAFPFAKKLVALEVPREDEFAPVKNAPGSASDSPDTARRLFSSLCARLWKSVGGSFVEPAKPSSESDELFEISPLASYAGEGLAQHLHASPVALPAQIEAADSDGGERKVPRR